MKEATRKTGFFGLLSLKSRVAGNSRTKAIRSFLKEKEMTRWTNVITGQQLYVFCLLMKIELFLYGAQRKEPSQSDTEWTTAATRFLGIVAAVGKDDSSYMHRAPEQACDV